jgi:hypothetical protein
MPLAGEILEQRPSSPKYDESFLSQAANVLPSNQRISSWTLPSQSLTSRSSAPSSGQNLGDNLAKEQKRYHMPFVFAEGASHWLLHNGHWSE